MGSTTSQEVTDKDQKVVNKEEPDEDNSKLGLRKVFFNQINKKGINKEVLLPRHNRVVGCFLLVQKLHSRNKKKGNQQLSMITYSNF